MCRPYRIGFHNDSAHSVKGRNHDIRIRNDFQIRNIGFLSDRNSQRSLHVCCIYRHYSLSGLMASVTVSCQFERKSLRFSGQVEAFLHRRSQPVASVFCLDRDRPGPGRCDIKDLNNGRSLFIRLILQGIVCLQFDGSHIHLQRSLSETSLLFHTRRDSQYDCRQRQ